LYSIDIYEQKSGSKTHGLAFQSVDNSIFSR